MGRPSFGVDAAPEGAVTPGWEDVAVAVHQAFCFELDPNNEARSALASHVGAARFAFNTMLAYVRWALDARAFERRTTGVAVTEVPWTLPSLRKVWNHQVKEWAAPWGPQNSKEAYSCGLARLAAALDNFSQSRRGRRAGPAMGFPRFKKKSGRRSFRVTTGAFGVVDDRHIRLPRIGVIRVKEPTVALRETGSTISRLGCCRPRCRSGPAGGSSASVASCNATTAPRSTPPMSPASTWA
jgi:hypothetical protein